MAQFAQSGSSMQPRCTIAIPCASLVGLTNGNGYMVGTDNSLTILPGAASPAALTTSTWQPFLRPPFLIDLGTDQPRGFMYSLDTTGTTLTGLTGGLVILAGVETVALSNSTVNPLWNSDNAQTLVTSVLLNVSYPPFASGNARVSSAVNAGVFWPRYMTFSLLATTWPTVGVGTIYIKGYA